MPAEIDVSTGVAALAYNERNGTPWHRLGKAIKGLFNVAELKEAVPELFFTVEKRPVYTTDVAVEGYPSIRVPGWMATVRTDTNRPLGIVSNSYREYQPEDLFLFAQALADEGALMDVAGSLYDGRLVFATLDVGEVYKFAFDPSEMLSKLVVSGGNDGRHALRAKATAVRVLCGNTYSEHLGAAGVDFVIRHTSRMDVKVEEAKAALGMTKRYVDSYKEAMEALAKRKMTMREIEQFTEVMVPIPDDGEKHVRLENARVLLRSLVTSSPSLDGMDQTAYRVFTASTEYADWGKVYRSAKGTPDEARALAVLDGTAAAFKEKALAVLRS